MRVLVVAPDQDLNVIPEVRQIQRLHHMSVLHGLVTPADIYQCARETAFAIIHFACHSGPDGVLLSNGMVLPAEDIAQIARLKRTKTIFFNSCEAGRLAGYAVWHGVRYAIHCKVALDDADAWKMPLAFYESLTNGHAGAIMEAYRNAASGDGEYGIEVDPAYVLQLEAAAAAAPAAAKPHAIVVESWQIAVMGLGLLAASGLLTLAINALAGRM
jgi:hypothetical protein